MYFYDYKLKIKIYENGHSNENLSYEIKREKAIEQELFCTFIRIDRDKKDFDIVRAINEIFGHFKQSTKKSLINKIPTRLLRLAFKSDKITKSKTIKCIVLKVYCPVVSNNGNVLHQL